MMKHVLGVAASLLCLAACNRQPEVQLKNATGNQVAQAVKQTGVVTSDSFEPGLWQSKVNIEEINIPGLPAEYASKMKQSIAENRTSSHCVTPEEVKKPREGFFGGDKSCKYQNFTMGGGKITVQMACTEEGSTQTTSLSGTYTPTTYSMGMSTAASGGARQGMSMKMHVDSQRVGECSGKDG